MKNLPLLTAEVLTALDIPFIECESYDLYLSKNDSYVNLCSGFDTKIFYIEIETNSATIWCKGDECPYAIIYHLFGDTAFITDLVKELTGAINYSLLSLLQEYSTKELRDNQ